MTEKQPFMHVSISARLALMQLHSLPPSAMHEAILPPPSASLHSPIFCMAERSSQTTECSGPLSASAGVLVPEASSLGGSPASVAHCNVATTAGAQAPRHSLAVGELRRQSQGEPPPFKHSSTLASLAMHSRRVVCCISFEHSPPLPPPPLPPPTAGSGGDAGSVQPMVSTMRSEQCPRQCCNVFDEAMHSHLPDPELKQVAVSLSAFMHSFNMRMLSCALHSGAGAEPGSGCATAVGAAASGPHFSAESTTVQHGPMQPEIVSDLARHWHCVSSPLRHATVPGSFATHDLSSGPALPESHCASGGSVPPDVSVV